jgi:tripartite-type tricarboxylate transporter receptor subunit TctC
MKRRDFIRASLVAAAAHGLPAAAQEFPSRPIRLLLSFPAGGSTDAVMRVLAENAGKFLGQTVVVEPRPGAAGILPAGLVQNAAPDGYTIAQIPSGVFRAPYVTKTTWDPTQDLQYVIGLSGYVFGVVVSANGPIRTWADFVSWAKANPGKLTFGTVGTLSTPYLTMEQIARRTGMDLLHVPYKGSADLIVALLSDQIMAVADSTSFGPHVQSGKFRFICVWSDARLQKYASTPTLKELGLDIVQTSPIGLAVHKATPPQIVKTLHDAFKHASEQPNFLERLATYDMVPNYMSPAVYTRYARETVAAENQLMETLGIKKAQ